MREQTDPYLHQDKGKGRAEQNVGDRGTCTDLVAGVCRSKQIQEDSIDTHSVGDSFEQVF